MDKSRVAGILVSYEAGIRIKIKLIVQLIELVKLMIYKLLNNNNKIRNNKIKRDKNDSNFYNIIDFLYKSK